VRAEAARSISGAPAALTEQRPLAGSLNERAVDAPLPTPSRRRGLAPSQPAVDERDQPSLMAYAGRPQALRRSPLIVEPMQRLSHVYRDAPFDREFRERVRAVIPVIAHVSDKVTERIAVGGSRSAVATAARLPLRGRSRILIRNGTAIPTGHVRRRQTRCVCRRDRRAPLRVRGPRGQLRRGRHGGSSLASIASAKSSPSMVICTSRPASPLLLCAEAVAKSRVRPRRLRRFADGAELRRV
jgi:hypothetical protein